MGYLINLWNESQKKFTMSFKQVVSIAGDGMLDNEEAIMELRSFLKLIDLPTMERFVKECYSKDKRYKFDTRGFAFQDLINEMGRRLGFEVINGLYRGKKNDVGYDGLWRSKDGHCIIMESKTSDDYSISMEAVIGYRDQLVTDKVVSKKKCSILIVYGRDDKNALLNTVKGSDDSKNVRLIGAMALFQLVRLYTVSHSTTILNQVNAILRPKDYFLLDNLVELVFPETNDHIFDMDETEDSESTSQSKTNYMKHPKCAGEQTYQIPPLPDRNLKIGQFIKTAMENLATSGYVFSDEMLEFLCSDNAMHEMGMQRHMPFLKLYDPEEENGYIINGRNRFYSQTFSFGQAVVYVNSQLFAEDREPFIEWYMKLRLAKCNTTE